MNRTLTDRDLAYEKIGSTWDAVISRYDTDRRIEVLIDEFLGRERVQGKDCMDAGCGLGYFTERLHSMGPRSLVATDLAPSLVESVAEKFPGVEGRVADLLEIDQAVEGRTFDTIVCSEVIEHTPDPRRAVAALARCLKPGGWLSLSVPNRRWKWTLTIAETLKMREHYQGYENWVSPAVLLKWLEESGLTIARKEGIHLVPWHFLPGTALRAVDRRVRSRSYGVGVNLAVLARRPLAGGESS